MAWFRKTRKVHRAQGRPLVDPDPLRTPDDAFETGFLTGSMKNAWQAIAVKNLKDRRIVTGDSRAESRFGPAGEAAGEVADHRAGEE